LVLVGIILLVYSLVELLRERVGNKQWNFTKEAGKMELEKGP
jgi:hypothetical protein